MAWSSPRTWSAGETVTAAMMNAHVRDNFNAVALRPLGMMVGAPGSVVVSTGIKAALPIVTNCRATRWDAVANETGSIQIDLWKKAYGSLPATNPDSITGSSPIAISSGIKAQDTNLSDWTVDLDAGDWLYVNVDSATTVKWCVFALTLEPR